MNSTGICLINQHKFNNTSKIISLFLFVLKIKVKTNINFKSNNIEHMNLILIDNKIKY